MLREWLSQIAADLFSPERGLFVRGAEDGRMVHPAPHPGLMPPAVASGAGARGKGAGAGKRGEEVQEHLGYMRFAGRIVGEWGARVEGKAGSGAGFEPCVEGCSGRRGASCAYLVPVGLPRCCPLCTISMRGTRGPVRETLAPLLPPIMHDFQTVIPRACFPRPGLALRANMPLGVVLSSGLWAHMTGRKATLADLRQLDPQVRQGGAAHQCTVLYKIRICKRVVGCLGVNKFRYCCL